MVASCRVASAGGLAAAIHNDVIVLGLAASVGPGVVLSKSLQRLTLTRNSLTYV